MKNPKKLNLQEKRILHDQGKNPEEWYVVKKSHLHLEIVKKSDFDKFGSQAKTEIIMF